MIDRMLSVMARGLPLLILSLNSLGQFVFADEAVPAEGRYVEIWVRKPGNYADGTNWPKDHLRKFDLDAQPAKKREMFDFQYGRKYSFKGVPLQDIIASFEAASGTDYVLLHFSNKMIVPMPLQSESFDRLDALVAREVQVGKTWKKEFPSQPKKDPIYADPRPIQFQGNKMVVQKPWHPTAEKQGQGGFSPWRFTSALTGVEFINRKAYERQFLVDDSETVASGFQAFSGRCAFCHSVRQIGARFGWDFVDPLPTYKQKSPEHLLNHVKYPKWDALERGLMMPPQKDVAAGEIFLLWKWMEAVATKPAKPYAP